MASHLERIIESRHPEQEEDELSELALGVAESAEARDELAQHFRATASEECVVMSILHNGSPDACGFVCWALHALAADADSRDALCCPYVATGLRDAVGAPGAHEEVQWSAMRVMELIAEQLSGYVAGSQPPTRGSRELRGW